MSLHVVHQKNEDLAIRLGPYYTGILIVMIAITVFYPNNWAFIGIITALMLVIW